MSYIQIAITDYLNVDGIDVFRLEDGAYIVATLEGSISVEQVSYINELSDSNSDFMYLHTELATLDVEKILPLATVDVNGNTHILYYFYYDDFASLVSNYLNDLNSLQT